MIGAATAGQRRKLLTVADELARYTLVGTTGYALANHRGRRTILLVVVMLRFVSHDNVVTFA
jgi:hypothetical protein